MKIVLINGKKRAGKDYFAKSLKAELEALDKTVAIFSFADPIKEILAKSLGITIQELDEYKNSNSEIYIKKRKITDARKLLQNFGTEAMKSIFGEDVWVNLLEEKALSLNKDFVLVPDFRFLIEYISPYTVKIENKSIDSSDGHKSENELNDFEFNYIIDNTGYNKNLIHQAQEYAHYVLNDGIETKLEFLK